MALTRGTVTTRRWLACVLIAAPIPTPIGFGQRYQLAAGPPRDGRLTCTPAEPPRQAAHVELFANKLVLLLPKGIGAGRGCSYPVRTTEPTGAALRLSIEPLYQAPRSGRRSERRSA